MNGPYRYLRRKLHDAGLKPRSTLARLGLVLLVLVLGLIVTRRLIDFAWPGRGTALAGWATFFTFILCIVAFLLGLRWVRQRLMWRLRNRLIVTYVFMGFIPIVLLVVLGIVTAYFLTGQFATFIVTNDLQAELRTMAAANEVSAMELMRDLKRSDRSSGIRGVEGTFGASEVTAWLNDRPVLTVGQGHSSEPLLPPPMIGDDFRSIVLDDGRLHLRVVKVTSLGRDRLTMIASIPLDRTLLGKLAAGLGEVTLYLPDTVQAGASSPSDARQARLSRSAPRPPGSRASTTAGTLAPAINFYDREVNFPTQITITDWKTGKPLEGESGSASEAFLVVTTRPSLLSGRLFQTLGEFGSKIMLVIVVVAIIFGIIELVALFIGLRLTRTMTASVAALYQATQHVNKGDLTHRIKIRSTDQLAALETSFNSMTVSLQRLMEEQKQKQRLESELAIAQEVQALLFPRDITELESLEVHGICKPARTVSGDYYDFLPINANRLGIAVGDISGKGISAALLMATVHAFVRAYTLVEQVPALALPAAVGGPTPQQSSSIRMSRRDGEELPPGTLMCMLNHQLYKSTPSEKYATMFLSFYDQRTRKLQYANAGHLPPIVLGNDGTVRRLDTSGLVVGLFGDMTYPDDEITMNPGDIFIAYSDGITEPENEFGEFGEDRLIELVQENRDLPLARISEIVTQAVSDWIGGSEQPDDVTLVLARTR
jgi:phosphoserine phosphatase RsbU/P